MEIYFSSPLNAIYSPTMNPSPSGFGIIPILSSIYSLTSLLKFPPVIVIVELLVSPELVYFSIAPYPELPVREPPEIVTTVSFSIRRAALFSLEIVPPLILIWDSSEAEIAGVRCV